MSPETKKLNIAFLNRQIINLIHFTQCYIIPQTHSALPHFMTMHNNSTELNKTFQYYLLHTYRNTKHYVASYINITVAIACVDPEGYLIS